MPSHNSNDDDAGEAQNVGSSAVRQGYGQLPGAEFPGAVYCSVIAAFGLILLISWAAFGGETDADLSLGLASVLAIVFFALPVVMRRTAAAHSAAKAGTLDQFLSSRVEIATGALSGTEAWVQVLIIPLALLLAAIAIGAVHAFVA